VLCWGGGGVKAAGAWGWQPYHIYAPTVLKSGSLNLLEPSGPLQAGNGIILHYIYIYICVCVLQRRVLSIKSGCYDEHRCYNERTIGRRNTRVLMMCRSFPLWSERQPSSLLSFVSSSYQFSLVQLSAYLRLQWWKYFLKLLCYIILTKSRQNREIKLINLDIKK